MPNVNPKKMQTLKFAFFQLKNTNYHGGQLTITSVIFVPETEPIPFVTVHV